METMQIHESKLAEASALASNVGLLLSIISRKTGNAADEILEVAVVPNQSKSGPVILGRALITGGLYEFTADWHFDKATFDALDWQRCDTCHVHHRRKEVYIVRQPSGQIEQVGGSCAMLYSKTTRSWISAIKKTVKKLRAYTWCSVDVEEVLRMSVGVIRKDGFYISKNNFQADKGPTATQVHWLVFDKPFVSSHPTMGAYDQKRLEEWNAARTEILSKVPETEITGKVYAWLKAQPFSTFTQNCIDAIGTGNRRLLPFLVASVIGWEKSTRAPKPAPVQKTYKPVQAGQRLCIKDAKVLKVEGGSFYIYSYERPFSKVTVLDENYGKIWFKTYAQDLLDIRTGDSLSCSLAISKVLDRIAFAKRVTKVSVIKSI